MITTRDAAGPPGEKVTNMAANAGPNNTCVQRNVLGEPEKGQPR